MIENKKRTKSKRNSTACVLLLLFYVNVLCVNIKRNYWVTLKLPNLFRDISSVIRQKDKSPPSWDSPFCLITNDLWVSFMGRIKFLLTNTESSNYWQSFIRKHATKVYIFLLLFSFILFFSGKYFISNSVLEMLPFINEMVHDW